MLLDLIVVLFKHLNPEWVDITGYLPLDRAIPQQIPHNLVEIPSYTQAEGNKRWLDMANST
jgi:hypothetical protein